MGIFNEMAARYDTPERAQVAAVIAGAIRGQVADMTDKTAVDYGCGTGLVGLQLADCFQSLLLVDAAPNMIEQVRGKIRDGQIPNAHVLCADFSAELPSKLSADAIFMAQVLLHIPDTETILRQLYRLLKPGGILLVVDFDKEESIPSDKVHNGFDQRELIGLVQRIGYRGATAHTFYHGKNIFMNRDASLFLLRAMKPLNPPEGVHSPPLGADL